MSTAEQPESSEFTSPDKAGAIDRVALEEARCLEGAERYRNNPGPLVPPITLVVAP